MFAKLEAMKFWRNLLIGLNLFLISSLILTSGWLTFFSQQRSVNLDKISGEFDPLGTTAVFNNQSFDISDFLIAESEIRPVVLGETNEEKRIEIDLTNQKVYAYEGSRKVYEFLVSTGKWGRTPTGTFKIANKFRYTKMSGGSVALHTYYYLPNVPYVMFFGNSQIPASKGFSLHGTYWHNNFGHPMSHGCVNMKTEEAGIIYYWAMPDLRGKQSIAASSDNPGTTIVVYGEAPKT